MLVLKLAERVFCNCRNLADILADSSGNSSADS